MLIFLDNILVYSSTKEEHLVHLQMTLETLRTHKLYAQKSKCSFGQAKVEYLGHLISQNGEADLDKIVTMLR